MNKGSARSRRVGALSISSNSRRPFVSSAIPQTNTRETMSLQPGRITGIYVAEYAADADLEYTYVGQAWPEDAVPMPAPAQVIAQIDMLLASETSQDVIDALLDHRLDMMEARKWV